MQIQKRIKSALLALFPTPESYIRFTAAQENSEVLNSLTTTAFKHHLIDAPNPNNFHHLIQANTVDHHDFTPSNNLNFDLFLEQKGKLLEFSLSLRALTDRINTLLTTHNILLPKVTNQLKCHHSTDACSGF